MTTQSFCAAVMETTQCAVLHHVSIPSGCCKGLLTVILFEEVLEKQSGVPKGIFCGKSIILCISVQSACKPSSAESEMVHERHRTPNKVREVAPLRQPF